MRQACRLLLLALPQGTQLGGGLGQLKLRQRRGGVRQCLAGLLLPGGGLLLLLRQLVAAGQPLELLLLALLSEIPFDLMYAGTSFFPFHQNVIWTFLIALFCMWVIERVKRRGNLWLTLLAAAGMSLAGWLAGTIAMVDYYGAGVLTVLLFYLFRGGLWWQRLGQAAGMIWINCGLLAGLVLQVNILGLTVEFPQQGFALLALIPIWLYRGRQGYHSRWVQMACYLFYPVHILVLAMMVRFLL